MYACVCTNINKEKLYGRIIRTKRYSLEHKDEE
jgi:hypothetical protein